MSEPQPSSERVTPRVAIVVTCFNDGRYIEEAVSSLTCQEPVELVVVDDGSSDPLTIEVLERLEGRGVRVIHQENTGTCGARMVGLRSTAARFVHPLDADDKLAPGALSVLADLLETHPDSGVAWGDYETFGARECRVPTAPGLDPWRITFLDEIPGTSMFRREALVDVGGWDYEGYEDWDLLMSLAERGWTGTRAARMVLLYRQHEGLSRFSTQYQRDEHWMRQIKARHADLFWARGRHRPAAPSPRSVKILFTLISMLPLISERRRRQGYATVRAVFQPELRPSCSPTFRQILARLLGSVRAALVPGEGRSR